MPKISTYDRNRMIVLNEEGYNQVKIAERVNCCRSVVKKIVNKIHQSW